MYIIIKHSEDNIEIVDKSDVAPMEVIEGTPTYVMYEDDNCVRLGYASREDAETAVRQYRERQAAKQA
jgi:hypothetical protein